jgi:hypothetical protein
VDFVDDVNPGSASERKIPDSVTQATDVFDAGVRSSVYFEDVGGISACDFHTRIAFEAGVDRGAFLAIDRFCEDACYGCLSDTPIPGKKKSLGQFAGLQGAGESPNDKFLPGKIGKKLGTPFSGQRQDG